MRDDLNYIDELYKTELSGISEEAGSGVWRKLFWSLFWWRNKWYLLLGAAVLFIGFGVFSIYNAKEDRTPGSSNPVSKTEIKNSLSEGNSDANSQYALESSVAGKNVNEKQSEPVKEISSPTQSTSIKGIDNNNVMMAANEASIPDYTRENFDMHKERLSITLLPAKSIGLDTQLYPDSIRLGDNRRTDMVLYGVKDKRYSLSVFGGPLLSQSALSGYENEYLTYRKSHETSAPGWTAGAVFKYHLKNWTFGAGLNYSEYRTYRDYNYSYNTYDPGNSYYDYDTTWFWVYDAPDIGKPMVKEIDSIWVKVYKESIVNNSGYNHVSYLEVPVLIGYQFKMNHLNVELNTGFSVGFLISSHYKVPDFNNYQDIVEVTQMNRLMVNYLASVTLYYSLDEDLSLFVAPGYRQNLQSIFKTNYPLKEQLKTFGLTLGVAFSF